MSREYGYSEGQDQEPMVWDRVEWRQGDGRYVFEVARGGLLATLSSPHGAKLTLPMVAWEGLLDALAAARKTKARAERNLPSRTGARWSESEVQELAKAFKAGARSPSSPGFTTEPNSPSKPSSSGRASGIARRGGRPRASWAIIRRPAQYPLTPPQQLAIPPALRSGPPAELVPDRRPDAKPQPPFGKVDVHQRLPAGPEPSRFNRDVPATQKPGASAPGSDRLEGAGGDLRPKG